MLAAGLTRRQIEVRAQRGRLFPGPRGVWSVGFPPQSREARCAAAVLAVRGGVLAGRSAADLLGIWPNARSCEVVIAAGNARSRGGVRVLRRQLDPADVTTIAGIAVTTLARTLLDLAAELGPGQLLVALTRARVDHRLSDDALRDVLARHPRHRGTGPLGAALAGPVTASGLERAFARLLDDAPEIPPATWQLPVGPYRCDVAWPAARVVVELDGPHHAGQWARDAERDARLVAQGWRVIRLTRWDVVRDAARTRARIVSLLRMPPQRWHT